MAKVNAVHFPDRAERIMRPHPRWLNAVVTHAYDRYDGPRSEDKPWIVRQFWNFVGDRADDVRLFWNRRPVRRP